jgi:hypothetical protein
MYQSFQCPKIETLSSPPPHILPHTYPIRDKYRNSLVRSNEILLHLKMASLFNIDREFWSLWQLLKEKKFNF